MVVYIIANNVFDRLGAFANESDAQRYCDDMNRMNRMNSNGTYNNYHYTTLPIHSEYKPQE